MMKNLFTSPLWDAARAVEATTLSLMTGEKAAALSRAMGELTYVGREVYKEENWQKLIIEMLSMDLWVKKGAGQQLTEEVLETSRMKVTYLGGHQLLQMLQM